MDMIQLPFLLLLALAGMNPATSSTPSANTLIYCIAITGPSCVSRTNNRGQDRPNPGLLDLEKGCRAGPGDRLGLPPGVRPVEVFPLELLRQLRRDVARPPTGREEAAQNLDRVEVILDGGRAVVVGLHRPH